MLKPLILSILIVAAINAPAAELQRMGGVTLVATDFNDGDSFRVSHQGREQIIRLYYVDCPETRATTQADAGRVREQTRYFGLTDAAQTRLYGEKAAAFTKEHLARPFTVYTAYADARGRSEDGRVYGFVVTADGQDLATLLVENGLARSYGVRRELPDGTPRDEATARLDDLEVVALLKRKGVWEKTDPDRLVELRAAARLEEAELQGLIQSPPANAIDLNTATIEELKSINGVGDATAKKIIELRPFHRPADLDRIPRLPAATRSNILERALWP